jgi:hypothetical protein
MRDEPNIDALPPLFAAGSKGRNVDIVARRPVTATGAPVDPKDSNLSICYLIWTPEGATEMKITHVQAIYLRLPEIQ